jgi:hypothetical protein
MNFNIAVIYNTTMSQHCKPQRPNTTTICNALSYNVVTIYSATVRRSSHCLFPSSRSSCMPQSVVASVSRPPSLQSSRAFCSIMASVVLSVALPFRLTSVNFSSNFRPTSVSFPSNFHRTFIHPTSCCPLSYVMCLESYCIVVIRPTLLHFNILLSYH